MPADSTSPPPRSGGASPGAQAASDAARLSSEMYKTWEKAMGAWWDQVLETPAFLGAVNQNLAGAAKARGQWTSAVDQAMEQAHLPSRGDVVRMLKVATLLEDKLLAQEDLLLELRDRLDAAEREAIQARIEATEARIEARDTLRAVLARLDAALEPAASAPTGEPPAASQQETPASPAAPQRRRAPGK